MPHYLARIDDREFDIELDYGPDGYRLTVNGTAFGVKSHRLSDTRQLMFVDGWSHEVDVDACGYDSRSIVFMQGVEIPVEIEDYNLAQMRKTAGMSSGPTMDKVLRAPMPGLVLEIKVEPGDEVRKGQPLLIVEAMKMENVIKAEGDGVVALVHVTPGASAEKGDKLLEFE